MSDSTPTEPADAGPIPTVNDEHPDNDLGDEGVELGDENEDEDPTGELAYDAGYGAGYDHHGLIAAGALTTEQAEAKRDAKRDHWSRVQDGLDLHYLDGYAAGALAAAAEPEPEAE